MMNREKKTYRIARIDGDGIGPEVISEAVKVLESAGRAQGLGFEWTEFPFGARHYLESGEILPEPALVELGRHDALLLGAIGDPSVKPGILEQGILLKLRFHFDQYVNLRPAKSYPRVPLPVKAPSMDTVVVRENTEDFYMGLGARCGTSPLEADISAGRSAYTIRGHLRLDFDPPCASAVQIGIATEDAVRRITAFACRTAKNRREESLVLASKSNALSWIYGFWEEVAADEAKKEGMALSIANVDALCYHLVRDPGRYGVILTPNMFGDIVSDLLAGIAGGLGVAAGANIGDGLSMFEPVHGSAPDIAGTGRANPVAAILSAAMMLRHLGEETAAAAVENAVVSFLDESEEKELPWEFGGKGSVSGVGDAIAERTSGSSR
ncbi:MAG: isocitrate/isopropylmalate family dehydrogenase [Thermovirgaceae bacterium]|nr:isocitrate/isopropylmalate family dehydrogenase [Thermovirgaceae bacterium]